MAERIEITNPNTLSEAQRLVHPFTRDVIADMQDVEEEMEVRDGDYNEVFVRVDPEHFHLAMGARIFDALSSIRENGMFMSQRAARFLQENLNVEVELVTEEPSQFGLNNDYEETETETEIADAHIDRNQSSERDVKDSTIRLLSGSKANLIWTSGSRSRETLRRESLQIG